jgi:hypothetical protein
MFIVFDTTLSRISIPHVSCSLPVLSGSRLYGIRPNVVRFQAPRTGTYCVGLNLIYDSLHLTPYLCWKVWNLR